MDAMLLGNRVRVRRQNVSQAGQAGYPAGQAGNPKSQTAKSQKSAPQALSLVWRLGFPVHYRLKPVRYSQVRD